MKATHLGLIGLGLLIGFGLTFFPEVSLAQFAGGDFQTRVNGITNGLISTVLPAVSILGLVYAAILAATGDAGAKQRMILVIIASLIGFIAPVIIRFVQSAAGG